MDWNEKYGWAPPILSFRISNGRVIDLFQFRIEATHKGILEGRPKVERVRKKLKTLPLYCEPPVVILPVDILPIDSDDPQSDFFLPKFLIELNLESDALIVGEGIGSRLRVIFLLNDVSNFNIQELIDTIAPSLDWENSAVDFWP